jgi:hypothetical protein
MSEILNSAITACRKAPSFFCKFISPNDSGATGAHQSGFYIPKNSISLLFDTPGIKGDNKDKYVKIKWQDDFYTDSRFIYYGKGTRNEYRITRFQKGFPFLSDEYMGDLFVLVKLSEYDYLAYVLDNDEDIENFLSVFNMTPTDTNRLIENNIVYTEEDMLRESFATYISKLEIDFPSTQEISKSARNMYYKCGHNAKGITENPDKELVKWMEVEYNLFKAIEADRYRSVISSPFKSIDNLIECANTLLNRRKSRAGKSLEHHLSEIFTQNHIPFTSQGITEGNKRPDFIFPGIKEYHDPNFIINNLIFLGAKTTCKDRWRQILNEADKIKVKHLFTLQQGISQNQLREMYDNNVILVVPETYRKTFPKEYQDKIMNLYSFIMYVKETSC